MFTDQCQSQLMEKSVSIRHDIESELFENILYDTIVKVKWRNIINHSSKIEKRTLCWKFIYDLTLFVLLVMYPGPLWGG
jgi:hypothetical protein